MDGFCELWHELTAESHVVDITSALVPTTEIIDLLSVRRRDQYLTEEPAGNLGKTDDSKSQISTPEFSCGVLTGDFQEKSKL